MNIDGLDRVKGSWSPKEDATLVKLVDQLGPRNWPFISTGIPGWTGKSCRLRWCNQLSPSVRHRPFTPAEDELIIEAHRIHGNKWAAIARILPGCTDNAIKNHGNSTHRRQHPRPTSGSSSAIIKQPLSPLSCNGEEALSSESSAKRQRLKIRTSLTLTLSPPWEGGASSMEEENENENENEAAPAVEMETGDRKGDGDRSNNIVGKLEVDAYLVTIMKRMIAEEVRKYIHSLWLQNNGSAPSLTVRKDP